MNRPSRRTQSAAARSGMPGRRRQWRASVPTSRLPLCGRMGSNRLRCGQAMIESVFVIIVACLCFFAIFQYANLFAAKAVLSHAAARAARSRAVGFNQWMVVKSARVAAIPASGRRLTPASVGVDPAVRAALQRNRVGDIWDLALEDRRPLPGHPTGGRRVPTTWTAITTLMLSTCSIITLMPFRRHQGADGCRADHPGILTVNLYQRHPRSSRSNHWPAELRDAGEVDELALGAFYSIESHYPLYMEDMNW